MKRTAVTVLLALLLFFGNTTTSLENTSIESISDSVGISVSLWNHDENSAFKQRINVAPFSRLNITVTDIPSDIWFIVLQIHTFQYNATLSYDKALLDKVSNRSLFGSNIGLYLKTYNVKAPIQVFLKHDNVHNLDALLVIATYGRHAPIPGGCNMEFDIEIAPYQKLNAVDEMIIVDTQPASVLSPYGLPYPCGKKSVQHKMYRLYLPGQDFSPETYFDAIARMLTVQDIVRIGDEIPLALTSPMRRIYSAYPGTGSVYVAVATYGNYSSAYVPIFSYACSPLLYPESCQILNDTFAKVVCAQILIIGFLSIITGHKYSRIDGLLPSCMIGGIIGYSLAVGTSVHDTGINVLIALTLAFISAAISALLNFFEFTLLRNLPFGFLCACITYLYAPANMSYVMESDWLFWPLFISLALAVAMLLNMMFYIAEIITHAVFGSSFVIFAIDYYVGSNLKYIIITFIRRVTIPGFHLAFVYPPYQGADITLVVIWFVLIIVRFIIQGCSKFIGENVSSIASSGDNGEMDPLFNSHYGNYSNEARNFVKRSRKSYWRRYYKSPTHF